MTILLIIDMDEMLIYSRRRI